MSHCQHEQARSRQASLKKHDWPRMLTLGQDLMNVVSILITVVIMIMVF